MSQKLALAVCVVAGLIACAFGQSFNPFACSNNARDEINKYVTDMMQAGTEYTSSLTQTGGQMVDMTQTTEDFRQMAEVMSQMVDIREGFDANRMMENWTKLMSIQTRLMMSSMRVSVWTGSMRSWMKFMGKMNGANMNLVSNMSQGCMPTNKVAAGERA